MLSKQRDIGWKHATSFGGSRKLVKCNYCGKTVHDGITRMKKALSTHIRPGGTLPESPQKNAYTIEESIS